MQNKYLHIILSVAAILCFIPGILQPILTLSMTAQIDTQVLDTNVKIMDDSHSIMSTLKDLWSHNALFATILIFVFSIINPIVKTVLFLTCLFINDQKLHDRYLAFLGFISKWSFADVLTVAVLIAYLTAARNPESITESLSIMGIAIPIKVTLPMVADFGPGFYWFAAFCLISNIGISVYMLGEKLKKV